MSMIDDIRKDREAGTDPKYGGWSWSGGRDNLMLCTRGGGHVYVMGFCRKGFGSAQPMFQIKGRGMVKAIDALTCYQVGDETVRGQVEAYKNPSVYRMDVSGVDHPDARRIARVPDMEAALLAAEELAHRAAQVFQSEYHNTRHLEGAREYYDENMKTLAAFRKATEDAA